MSDLGSLGAASVDVVANLDKLDEGFEEAKRTARQASRDIGAIFESELRRGQLIAQDMKMIGRTMSLALTAPIVGLGYKSFSSSLGFEDALSNLKTLHGATAEEMKLWRTELPKLGPQLGMSATDLARGLEEVIASGARGAQSLDMLTTAVKGAQTGLAPLNLILTTSRSVMNSFSKEGLTLERVIGGMLAGARDAVGGTQSFVGVLRIAAREGAAANLTFTDTVALLNILTRTSGNSRAALMSFRSVVAALGHPALRKTLNEEGLLGVLQKISKGGPEMAKAFDKMEGGRRLITSLQAIFKTGGKTIEDVIERVKNSGGDLSKAWEDTIGDSSFKMKQIMAETSTAFIAIGEAIKGPLIVALQAAAKNLSELSGLFMSLTTAQQGYVMGTVAAVAAIGPLISVLANVAIVVNLARAAFVAAGAVMGVGGTVALGATTLIGILGALAGGWWLVKHAADAAKQAQIDAVAVKVAEVPLPAPGAPKQFWTDALQRKDMARGVAPSLEQLQQNTIAAAKSMATVQQQLAADLRRNEIAKRRMFESVPEQSITPEWRAEVEASYSRREAALKAKATIERERLSRTAEYYGEQFTSRMAGPAPDTSMGIPDELLDLLRPGGGGGGKAGKDKASQALSELRETLSRESLLRQLALGAMEEGPREFAQIQAALQETIGQLEIMKTERIQALQEAGKSYAEAHRQATEELRQGVIDAHRGAAVAETELYKSISEDLKSQVDAATVEYLNASGKRVEAIEYERDITIASLDEMATKFLENPAMDRDRRTEFLAYIEELKRLKRDTAELSTGDTLDPMKQLKEQTKDLFVSGIAKLGDVAVDTFQALISGSKSAGDAFRDFAVDILTSIAKMIAQFFILWGVLQLLSMIPGGQAVLAFMGIGGIGASSGGGAVGGSASLGGNGAGGGFIASQGFGLSAPAGGSVLSGKTIRSGRGVGEVKVEVNNYEPVEITQSVTDSIDRRRIVLTVGRAMAEDTKTRGPGDQALRSANVVRPRLQRR